MSHLMLEEAIVYALQRAQMVAAVPAPVDLRADEE